MKDQVIPLVAIGNTQPFKRCTTCSVYEEDEIIVSDGSWVVDALMVVIVMAHVLHGRIVYLHNVYELWKERCSSDKEAVDVGAGHQGPAGRSNIRCY